MASSLQKNDLVMLLEAVESPAVPKDAIGQVQQVLESGKVEVRFHEDGFEHIATLAVELAQLYSFKQHKTMTDDNFWQIIEECRKQSNNDEEFITIVTNKLAQESIPNIYEYDRLFNHYRDKAYTNELWAAAYVINGGCSDDGFTDFRAWLIAQGQTAYNNALENPETLVDVAQVVETEYGPYADASLEMMNYLAWDAFEQKTGNEMPIFYGEHPDLTGEEWDEDTVYDLYPKLAAKFSDPSDD